MRKADFTLLAFTKNTKRVEDPTVITNDCHDLNMVSKHPGNKSFARRKTQQGNAEVPSFNLWRSFKRTTKEDTSNHNTGNTPYLLHTHPMKVHLLSIDVRGINNDQKLGIIRDYIVSLSLRVGILCLQEHKLKGGKVEKNIRTLWKSDTEYILSFDLSSFIHSKHYSSH